MTLQEFKNITIGTQLYHITRGKVKIKSIHSDRIIVEMPPINSGIYDEVAFMADNTNVNGEDRHISELFTYPVKIVKA